jgi:hypothetical protein
LTGNGRDHEVLYLELNFCVCGVDNPFSCCHTSSVLSVGYVEVYSPWSMVHRRLLL